MNGNYRYLCVFYIKIMNEWKSKIRFDFWMMINCHLLFWPLLVHNIPYNGKSKVYYRYTYYIESNNVTNYEFAYITPKMSITHSMTQNTFSLKSNKETMRSVHIRVEVHAVVWCKVLKANKSAITMGRR